MVAIAAARKTVHVTPSPHIRDTSLRSAKKATPISGPTPQNRKSATVSRRCMRVGRQAIGEDSTPRGHQRAIDPIVSLPRKVSSFLT